MGEKCQMICLGLFRTSFQVDFGISNSIIELSPIKIQGEIYETIISYFCHLLLIV